MQFSDTTNKNGILQMIEKTCLMDDGEITGNAQKLAFFTGLANETQHFVDQLIKDVQGEWAHDDANNTDFPIEEFDFTDDKQDYGLTTDGERDSWVIKKVEIRNASTEEYSTIDLCLQKDIPEDPFNQNSGTPTKYWLNGGSIIFDIPPDTDLVDKYRITYDRGASLFETDDTTKEPGIDQRFHWIYVFHPSLAWAILKGFANVKLLCQTKLGLNDADQILSNGLLNRMQSFYLNRAKEFKPAISRKKVNWG